MNNDITLNANEFKLAYSDKTGSLRRNTALGANLPRELRISHQQTVESKAKLSTRRTLIRFDRTVPDAEGKPLSVPVSVYLVAVVPVLGETSAVAAAITDGTVAIRQLISPTGADANALNLATNILVNQEQ